MNGTAGVIFWLRRIVAMAVSGLLCSVVAAVTLGTVVGFVSNLLGNVGGD